jgi:Protein of unknown function (DUF1236)
MNHSGSRVWMLALVTVVALAQHQALARMPREVVQPNLAASLSGSTLPHMRLAHAFLTSAEQSAIWRILSDRANRTSVPTGLNVGEKVPNTIRLLSFAHDLRKRIPAIWPYSYALLHDQVLIVDPRSKAIVAIIAEQHQLIIPMNPRVRMIGREWIATDTK